MSPLGYRDSSDWREYASLAPAALAARLTIAAVIIGGGWWLTGWLQ